VRVKGKVQGSLGADSGVGGAVPADEGFVVPEPKFAAPPVAPLRYRQRPLGVELEQVSSLVRFEAVRIDARNAVLPGLPGAPPGAGEIQIVCDLPGELGK